jgi:ankyrin repeat protein
MKHNLEAKNIMMSFLSAASLRFPYPYESELNTFPLYLASGEVYEFKKFVFALLIEYPEALLQAGWQKLYFNPLHLACMHNRPDLVTLILKHNSTLLNLETVQGNTPLLLACKEEFVYIVVPVQRSIAAVSTEYCS